MDKVEEIAGRLERAIDRLPSISTPLMDGDNLAILLCGVFDNPDQPNDDDTGWTEDAVAGYDEVIKAIGDHFRAHLLGSRP